MDIHRLRNELLTRAALTFYATPRGVLMVRTTFPCFLTLSPAQFLRKIIDFPEALHKVFFVWVDVWQVFFSPLWRIIVTGIAVSRFSIVPAFLAPHIG